MPYGSGHLPSSLRRAALELAALKRPRLVLFTPTVTPPTSAYSSLRCFLPLYARRGPFSVRHVMSLRPQQGLRNLFTAIPAYLTPPAVFVGLVLALWFYKCCMMVIFQNKIIYMPSVPPFSRRETIEQYASACVPIKWKREMIKSLDGTRIALCIGNNDEMVSNKSRSSSKHLLILYFQGNASSLPPRLPSLSAVLNLLAHQNNRLRCTIVALSYRGFWASSGRASQPGIEKDAAAAVAFVQRLRVEIGSNTKLVLWGQSIGAGVATTAVANLLRGKYSQELSLGTLVDGLILETPFTSIRNMLIGLYPQKWLPYQYLWPFLRNSWDAEAALRIVRQNTNKLPILCLTAEKDEVVPSQHGKDIVRLCTELGFDVRHEEIRSALHTEALARQQGRLAVFEFLRHLDASPGDGRK